MRATRITAIVLPLLAALALVAAGCGGGSKNTAATTEATTTEVATTTEAATTKAETTTQATTTTKLGGFASTANCKQFEDLSTKLSAVSSGSANSADLKKEAQILDDYADKAPSDIKDDFKTLAAFVSKVADIYGNVSPGKVPDASTLQKLQGLQSDAKKVSAASQDIAAWATKNCTPGG